MLLNALVRTSAFCSNLFSFSLPGRGFGLMVEGVCKE